MDSYPLNWPSGKAREKYPVRNCRFEAVMATATRDLLHEVKLLGGRDLVISSNVRLKSNGLPYSNEPEPIDKGVAVYFMYKKKQMCFACDKWNLVRDNLWAITKTISALRGIERWGSGDMVEQAFTGFTALPAAEQPWQVLGVSSTATEDEIQAAYRRLASENHPDKGGDEHYMARINYARDVLLENICGDK